MSDAEEPEPRLRSIAIAVCENCIARKPGTCHVPGCVFIRFHIDDVPHLEYLSYYLDESSATLGLAESCTRRLPNSDLPGSTKTITES